MSEVTVPVIKFLFKKPWTVMEGAIEVRPAYEVENSESASNLATLLSNMSAALIVCSLQDKDDLIQLATALKAIKSTATATVYKVAVVNFSGKKQFEKSLGKLGILDLIEPNVNQKALRFKMDFLVKAIKAQIKKIPTSTETKVKNNEQAKGPAAVEEKAKASVNWTAPIECEDDIWWVRQNTDCKKVLTRWLLKIMGPSPNVAQWVEIPDQPNAWRFEIKADFRGPLILKEGIWVFRGTQKPDFIWQENLWLITGEKFELFCQTGETKEVRLSYAEKIISVAKNSEYAKVKLQAIEESFDRELVFRQEAEKKSDQGIDGDDATLQTTMEGEGAGSDVLDGKLSGKSSSSDLEGQLTGQLDARSNEDPKKPKHRKSIFEEEQSGNLQGQIDSEILGEAPKKKSDFAESSLESYLKNPTKKGKLSPEVKEDEVSAHDHGPSKEKAFEKEPRQGISEELPGHLQGEVKDHPVPAVAKEKEYAAEPAARSQKERAARIEREIAESFPELAGKKLEELSQKDLEKVRKKFQEKRLANLFGRSEVAQAKESRTNDPIASTPDQLSGELDGKIDPTVAEVAKEGAPKERSHADATDSVSADLRGRIESPEAGPRWGNDFEGETDQIPGTMGGRTERANGVGRPSVARENTHGEVNGAYRGGVKTDKALASRRPFEGDADQLPANLGGRTSGAKPQSPDSKNPFEGKTDQLAGHLGGMSKIGQGGKRGERDPFEGKTDQIAGYLGGKSRLGEGENKRRRSEDGDNIEFEPLNALGDSFDGELSNLHSLEEARRHKEESEKEQLALGQCYEDIHLTAQLTTKSMTYECQLNDAFDKTITFTCEQDDLTAGGAATVEIVIEYIGKSKQIKCNGFVSMVEDDGTGTQFITLELGEESAAEIEGIVSIFQERQQKVDYFMKLARGL